MEEPKKGVPRTTLKLKSPAARTSAAPKAPAAPVTRVAPVAPKRAARKPEAGNWADEHKSRMQADMDALGFADASPRERESQD